MLNPSSSSLHKKDYKLVLPSAASSSSSSSSSPSSRRTAVAAAAHQSSLTPPTQVRVIVPNTNHNMLLSPSSIAASHRRRRRYQQLVALLGCVFLAFFCVRKDEQHLLLRDDDDDSNNNQNQKRTAAVIAGQSESIRLRSSATLKSSTTTSKIKQISILGERNSGTRWTYDHVSKCFNHTLSVQKSLTRYKHWFQYENPRRYPHDTLVLAQFRNPYDWLKAMEHVPHHSPAHLRTKPNASVHAESAENDWRIFLTKPWTMERVGDDLLLPTNSKCQQEFQYKDIVSCLTEPLPKSHFNWTLRYSEHQPFYEMRNDGSGLPYDNILELRSDKIRNFLSVVNYPGVADAWVLQYEYLLSRGTEQLIRRLEEWTGVKAKCDPMPPQNRKQKKSRYVSSSFAAHVRQHLNWTVEGWIGYEMDMQREADQAW